MPENKEKTFGGELAGQLGRGDRDVQLSLSRALVDLSNIAEPTLGKVAENSNPVKTAYTCATELLRLGPELGLDTTIEETRCVIALGVDGMWPDTMPAAGAEAKRPQGTTENAEGAIAEAWWLQEGVDC